MKQCNPADIERSAHELFMFADTLCICINYSERIRVRGQRASKEHEKGIVNCKHEQGEIIDEKGVILAKVVIFWICY